MYACSVNIDGCLTSIHSLHKPREKPSSTNRTLALAPLLRHS